MSWPDEGCSDGATTVPREPLPPELLVLLPRRPQGQGRVGENGSPLCPAQPRFPAHSVWRSLEASKETRKALFDSMGDTQMRGVTFRLLLAWTIEHSKGKIALQKSDKSYKK